MMDKEIIDALRVIWDYMCIDAKLEKCDLIMGCGCANLEIPVKCAELYKKGYAPKVLFSGGYGKITEKTFRKTEAENYRDIAIKNGVPAKDIIIEPESTNTGDNFRYSMKLLDEMGMNINKMIVVHKKINERRTYLAAAKIIPDKEVFMSAPDKTFDEFIKDLEENENRDNVIAVIIGDIQRIVVYPQLGWQKEDNISAEVLNAYNVIKSKGYTKYLLSKEQIDELIKKSGLSGSFEPNYFI